MKRALFIDRDGTIIVEPADTQQVDSLERLEFIPGAITALAAIASQTGYELIMVSNQDGLGTPSFPEEHFRPAHDLMMKTLAGEGVQFAAVHIDRSFPHENANTRKPGTGMLGGYLDGSYDLKHSFVIGDRMTDLELAANLGAQGILIGDSLRPDAALVTRSWDEIARFVTAYEYRASVARTTKETSVQVHLALYGSGIVKVETGLGFLDHMLDLLGHHAGFDLDVRATGDLHVDEHHVIEDVGITLGEAFSKAVRRKVGMTRYGFLLPMDEALARVAVDLSGRSHLEWRADFRRERIGDVPTEMFKHFFKSFSDAARCSLHIEVQGDNEHHKIEAIFKGVGRSLREAVGRSGRSLSVPSTKGVL